MELVRRSETDVEESAQAAIDSIGMRVRSLRTARGLGLRELARRINVTPSMLSQIERSRVNPSVGTLFRLAECLGTTTDYFFGSRGGLETTDVVVPGSNRAWIELSGGIVWERLTPTDEHGFEFMHTIYPPGAVSSEELMRHSGRDYGVLLSGILEVAVGFRKYRLNPGDSIAFDASVPHQLSNPGPEPAETIWVVLDRHLAPGGGLSRRFTSPEDES